LYKGEAAKYKNMVVSIFPQGAIGTDLTSLIKGFILTQRTECKSQRTIEYYEGNLNRFLWFVEQNELPQDTKFITEWHIREFLGYVQGATKRWGLQGNGAEACRKQAKYSTVHHYYCALKVFFNWCLREDFLKDTPMRKIKLANPKLNVVRPYTEKELKLMLAVCDKDIRENARFIGSRNRAIILILLDSGLRVSELTGMRQEDVDTSRGWVKVKGKGAKERIVRIGSTAQKALWRYMIYRQKINAQALWLTEEGKPIASKGIQETIKRIKVRAGVNTPGSCHKFRHTFALSFLRKDRNPFNLQYLLGHSDLRMTRHYVSTLGAEDALKAHESASPADMLNIN
jgi:site-specific recombinase XerD